MTWAEIRDLVHQAVGWIVTYTRVAKSSAGGHDDEVEGRSEPDEPSYQIPVRRLWPFGLRSRPPAGVEAVVILVNGGGTRAVMVGAETAKYGPSNLAEGESALYSAVDGCLVKLDKDGAITLSNASGAKVEIDKNGKVTVTPAAGQDVVLAGGTLKVARVTDQLQGTAGPYPINGVVAATGGATNVKA